MDTIDLTQKDLCKSCKHYWVDFEITPDKRYVSHCEILDDKKGLLADMDNDVPYPCLECPFKCYVKK